MIKDILIDNGYFVKLEKIKNGCKVSYPKNIIKQPFYVAVDETYEISDNELCLKNGTRSKKKSFVPYAIRPYIMCDITLKAMFRNLNNSIICFEDNRATSKKIVEMIDYLPNEENLEREEKLISNLIKMLRNDVNGLDNLDDIKEGYDLVVEFLGKAVE